MRGTSKTGARLACVAAIIASGCWSQGGGGASFSDGGVLQTPEVDAGEALGGGGGVDADGGAIGGKDCVEVWACAISCDVLGCVDACIQQGTVTAQAFARSLASCSMTNRCGNDQCLYSACSGEYGACARDGNPTNWPTNWTGGAWSRGAGGGGGGGGTVDAGGGGGGGGGGGSGSWMCTDIIACAANCQGAPNCRAACIASGTPAEQAAYTALYQCFIANGCSSPECIAQNCPTQVDACSQHGYTCQVILQCAEECAPADAVCEQACVDAATPHGQYLLNVLNNCAIQYNCTNGLCVITNCAAELNACQTG